MLLSLCPMGLQADPVPELVTFAASPRVKVGYSFDHYANNSNMQHTYISEDMLRAAGTTSVWKSSAWNISQVANRLTGVLSLHTHSYSTTQKVHQDQQRIDKMRIYEKYIHTNWNDGVELVVYCRKGRGRTIEELVIFKFKNSYCSRVIQLTGKLRPEDITSIIRQN